jgi:hypothetical protein
VAPAVHHEHVGHDRYSGLGRCRRFAILPTGGGPESGGTWAGAVEQLDRLRLAPVYVRSTGAPSPGLDALRKKGAIPWPNPSDGNAFQSVLDVRASEVEAVARQRHLCQ